MVKIITSSKSHQDLEDKINEFVKSITAVRFDLTFSITPMHEFYHSDPTQISNSWIDYTVLIIY